jgi:surface carbohydrate biosynthesis protein|tara:strand:+ start:1885 stop:3255 length:1371 start_codon:yes stop_codon:yes gene_type:complete
MNIYIKVEVKLRELESRLLLAMAAAERGHQVLLGSNLLTLDLVKKKILQPGIIFEKSIVPSERRIRQLNAYKNNNCKITAIDEEGGFINNSFKDFLEERFSSSSIRLTDKIFTWGDRDYKKFRSHFNNYKKKFSATGNPRVDFWRKEFDYYYKNQKLSQIKPTDKFILLASNFGAMLHERRIWEEVKVLRDKKNFERGRDEFLYYEYKSYQIRLAAKFVKATRKISQKFKNLKIVIRPHPSESVEAWKSIIGNHKNIFVIKDGSIGKWIRKAKLVIHNSCTSGVESHASNIPTIVYRPFRSNFDFKFPNSLSINVFDEKNLIKEIEQILKKKNNTTRKKNKYFNNYFCNLRNKLAADNIVKEWEQLDNGKLSKKNNLFKLKTIANLKEFKGKIISQSFLNNDKNSIHNSAKYKFPKITSNELETITNNLRKTLNRFENVNVEQFSDRLILVNKKNN